MRITHIVFAALLFGAPAMAHAQTLSLQGAAGPTLGDRGYSASAGLGFSPTPRITVLASIERTHLVSRRQDFPNGYSYFRGGTYTLGSGELQVAVFGRDRVTPYGLVGFSAGRSRLNVNDVFPNPVVTDVRGPFAGGGIRVPLGQHAEFFSDLRLALVIGTEADNLYALLPLRAGLSWRF